MFFFMYLLLQYLVGAFQNVVPGFVVGAVIISAAAVLFSCTLRAVMRDIRKISIPTAPTRMANKSDDDDDDDDDVAAADDDETPPGENAVPLDEIVEIELSVGLCPAVALTA